MKKTENRGSTRPVLSSLAVFSALFLQPGAAAAQGDDSPLPALTYADLADLSDTATMVVKAQIRKHIAVEPERSPGLRPGWVRMYVEARTEALLSGSSAIGESLAYLADVPLDAKGKPPKLKNQSVLLFAHAVPGRADQLQLVDVDAQIPASGANEARVRAVLVELASPDARPALAGVRDALSVEGNLDGESETQVFLDTEEGVPVSLNVVRRPGMAPQWGVSWTEIVDQAARPPQRDTLEWYRLACFLPDSLPYDSIISRDGAARVRAAQDYRFILDQLGACPRNRS